MEIQILIFNDYIPLSAVLLKSTHMSRIHFYIKNLSHYFIEGGKVTNYRLVQKKQK